MLPPMLRRYIDTSLPKINPIIGQGLVFHDCANPMGRIDEVLNNSITNVIPGLKYEGWHYATPEAEYRERASLVMNEKFKANSNKQNAYKSKTPTTINVEQNDMRMVTLSFSYNGKPLVKRNILIHYVNKHNLMMINGARYRFSPVLYDAFPSVSRNDVFVQLDKAKVTFRNNRYVAILRNEQMERINVICTSVFNDKSNKRVSRDRAQTADVRMDTCLLHYMLCQYGITHTFENVLKLSKEKGEYLIYNEHEEPQYIKSGQYAVYESIKKQPNTYLGNTTVWQPCNIKVAIRLDKETPTVKNYIASLYYIMTNFSSKIDIAALDDTIMMRYTLGIVLFGPTESINMIVNKVDSHIKSLHTYMEPPTAKAIRQKGYKVYNIYDLMACVIENFDIWITWYKSNSSSCYGKTINARHYTYFQITRAINVLAFNLTSLYNRKGDRIRESDIIKELSNILSVRIAFKITKEHGSELTTISDCTDRPILSYGAHIVPQAQTSPAGRNRRASITPEILADASVSVACSHLALTKSSPHGRAFINPFIELSDDRIIKKPQAFKDLLDITQKYLKS